METCQRCGESGDDRRTLWMACFYAMNELGLPFEQKTLLSADLNDLVKEKEPVIFDSSEHFKGSQPQKNCFAVWNSTMQW